MLHVFSIINSYLKNIAYYLKNYNKIKIIIKYQSFTFNYKYIN